MQTFLEHFIDNGSLSTLLHLVHVLTTEYVKHIGKNKQILRKNIPFYFNHYKAMMIFNQIDQYKQFYKVFVSPSCDGVSYKA